MPASRLTSRTSPANSRDRDVLMVTRLDRLALLIRDRITLANSGERDAGFRSIGGPWGACHGPLPDSCTKKNWGESKHLGLDKKIAA
jgi:hypothetical protein